MGNTMLITFTSDSANEGQGFDVRYRLVQVKSTYAPCNQTLVASGTEQVLTSPGYPQISLLTQSCIFTIRAQSGYHIRVTLIDLDIEYSPACKHDSLTISDGTLTLDELWCGKRAGEVVNSQRNEITVIYGIDDSNNGQGFSLKYSEVRGSASRVQEMVMPVRNTPLYLTSPGFEKRFPQGITYSYIFTADPRQRIRLRVQESYLRYNTADGSCLSERVRLYDGPSSTSSELKSINTGEYGWCALDLPVFISSSNYMTMVFKTVNSFDHGRIGFVLMYEQGNFSDPLPCGESLTASLRKSYLMKKIQPHTSCTWVLTRETNNTYIQLNVLRYDVGRRNDDKCGADHVEIYDGDTEASSRIALLCGSKSGALYIGTGGQMMVKLVTGESPVTFHIEYSSSHEDRCTPKDRRATEQPDYLVSPSYPNKYASGLHCTWLIDSGNADYIVKFKVVQASIVSSVDCTYDYLAVYDGMSEATRVQLGKWCWGVDETETIYSTQRYLTVVFHTSKDNTASGFRLRYWRDAAPEEQGQATATGSNMGTILGGIFGGLIPLAVIIFII
ncbi:bone morphogenetic protein 1-like isoform X2 [Haliotis rufescens]|uniref:bone morphogenetic protein 1-like isoform X2 n=1 Tax=Haliotis rufescens TaxID=6454 RepID=UPI00201F05F2|nr:bone morphogenetic protein 1-like isoform X2 [Haliotis rufescens]